MDGKEEKGRVILATVILVRQPLWILIKGSGAEPAQQLAVLHTQGSVKARHGFNTAPNYRSTKY